MGLCRFGVVAREFGVTEELVYRSGSLYVRVCVRWCACVGLCRCVCTCVGVCVRGSVAAAVLLCTPVSVGSCVCILVSVGCYVCIVVSVGGLCGRVDHGQCVGSNPVDGPCVGVVSGLEKRRGSSEVTHDARCLRPEAARGRHLAGVGVGREHGPGRWRVSGVAGWRTSKVWVSSFLARVWRR